MERIDNPARNWKFSSSDLAERAHFDEYLDVYADVIDATATPESPWYALPADRKWYTRYLVSEIVLDALQQCSHLPAAGRRRTGRAQGLPHPTGGRVMPPIRVLQIMPAMDASGMETFVMNVYRTIDRERCSLISLYHYDKPCFLTMRYVPWAAVFTS